MNAYILLAIAIISEVFGSSMLKVTKGFKKVLPSIGVVLGYALAFYALSLSLKALPIGTAYAIWAGVGTALTALIGIVLYKKAYNRKKLFGLVLIICGVILLNLSTGDAFA
ncbi:DMT family transporter [Psychrobacillus lasiicapitis]|uniref:Multidrug efflux SMR transporter n=1 Tax=Psychrobacillus lasiicapitis TaxID=1636719 RepID=A0A544TAN9_9BACI|nr:multidrug efflux SMR transporter [Psychrobacillus lasiicapitis]TQR14541.1 multidrug efflux SMR transporter [Psychrobacillus lasiicapitis]GGA30496.1 QacE family quaternary ammonium compound efflux SMR transporter [Psychrobacillus lasiicapitis]